MRAYMTAQLNPMAQKNFRSKGYESVYTFADAYDVLYNNGMTIGVIESVKRPNIYFAEIRNIGVEGSERYGAAVGNWYDAMLEAIEIGCNALKSQYE